MNIEPGEERNEDSGLAQLVRAAGRREAPPAAMASQVRDAVRAEWRAAVTARARRRQWSRYAVAAGISAVAAGAWLLQPLQMRTAPAAEIASVARITGPVQYRDADGGEWSSATTRTVLHEHEQIRTAGGARAALAWQHGAGVRIDENTLATLDGDRIVLERGAVFIDTGEGGQSSDAPLVATALGTVRHLGTSYEVRVADEALRVSVRHGTIQVERAGAVDRGTAGEQLRVDSAGQVERTTVAAWDARWNWLHSVTPPLDIEGRSVADFLQWAGRETGRSVVYGSPAARAAAERIVLHGTIEGLDPATALRAVLSTTRLQHATDGGALVITAK